MTIKGKLFPSQGSREKVFLVLRRHWFTYLAFLIIAFIMAIPLFIALAYMLISPDTFSGTFGNALIIIGSAYTLFIVGLMLYGFVDYYLDVYIVTDERIVDITQSGFFKRSISELHLHEVQDVSARVEGFFATMVHYGQIEIQTAGERANFIFRAIPNPYRISKIIADLHEAQIESIIKEEIAEGVATTASRPSLYHHEEMGDGVRELGISESVKSGDITEARKRTKELLKETQDEDEEMREKMEEEIDDTRKNEMLDKIDNSLKNSVTGDNIEETDTTSANTDKGEAVNDGEDQTESTAESLSEESLKENEEKEL
jgi:hypothetical protein